ncbi:hypothetical protein LX36DRAFT_321151 [Colletotrichum falcatum]|nr:hypothetical protein LX36DRAFT_321151 [Colletotrichum falcatum]
MEKNYVLHCFQHPECLEAPRDSFIRHAPLKRDTRLAGAAGSLSPGWGVYLEEGRHFKTCLGRRPRPPGREPRVLRHLGGSSCPTSRRPFASAVTASRLRRSLWATSRRGFRPRYVLPNPSCVTTVY